MNIINLINFIKNKHSSFSALLQLQAILSKRMPPAMKNEEALYEKMPLAGRKKGYGWGARMKKQEDKSPQ